MLIGNGILNIVETSILARIKALATGATLTLGYPIKAVLFDDYTFIETLPEQDLIGAWQVEAEVDEHTLSGTFLITVSTFKDEGCFRLRNLLSLIFDDMLPMTEFGLYQPDGTSVKGSIIIMNGVKVLPVEKGEERPAKTLALPFKCTRTLGL